MPLAVRLGRHLGPMLRFLRSETAGGIMLIVSAVAAVALANSAAAPAYLAALRWEPPIPYERMPIHLWVNDGLMVVFFLLVGLELRREITRGELAGRGRLAAPALAALGGMVVPALIFAAFNWGDRAAMRGWAVPVATDIAFALAVASILGSRVPVALKVFLTALAIIDDLGAIIIIALFYTRDLDGLALGASAIVWLGLFGLNRLGVRSLWPYLVGGALLWALVFRSGVHATLAGVALAIVVPMGERQGRSPALRLEHSLVPWVSFGVLPLFGLTNAGLRFDTLPLGILTDPLAIGTTLALLLGKPIGVFAATMGASRLGWARLPRTVSTLQLFGAAALCGIGFTMSLFIGDLAFRHTPRGDEVKLAVFVGSCASALLGLAILAVARPRVLAPPHEAAHASGD